MIIEHNNLSIEKHVKPLLEAHGYSMIQDDEYAWFAFEGAPPSWLVRNFGSPKGHCVTICNSNELMTWNRRIADILSEKCRPFGKELKVHFNT